MTEEKNEQEATNERKKKVIGKKRLVTKKSMEQRELLESVKEPEDRVRKQFPSDAELEEWQKKKKKERIRRRRHQDESIHERHFQKVRSEAELKGPFFEETAFTEEKKSSERPQRSSHVEPKKIRRKPEPVLEPVEEEKPQVKNEEKTAHEKIPNEKHWGDSVPYPVYDSHENKEAVTLPNYLHAGFWMRLMAYLVDVLCITAITTIILGGFFGKFLSSDSTNLSIYGILSAIIYLGYFILMTKFTNGQTLGKMIFGLQVVCFNEERLTWQTVLVREGACRFILNIVKILYLPVVVTKSKQHVGDMLSDTSVITLNMVRAYKEQRI